MNRLMKGHIFGTGSLLATSLTWINDVVVAEWIAAFSAAITACFAAYFYYWHARLKQAEIAKIKEETKDLREH